MGDPLSLMQWLMVTIMIVLGSGAICFMVPIASRRMLRPRKKRLLDDDLAGIAESGHAQSLHGAEGVELAEAVSAEDEDDAMGKGEDEAEKHDIHRQFPERLLMLRVNVVKFDEDLDGLEGLEALGGALFK